MDGLLYSINADGKRCFHQHILYLMQKAKNEKLSSLIRDMDIKSQVDHTGSTLLHASAQFGTTYLTTYFIKAAKIDVNVRNDYGVTPLMLATRNFNYDMVRHLLDNDADMCLKDVNGISSLMIVSSNRDNKMFIELFVQHIKKICSNDVEIADLLIRAGNLLYRLDAFKSANITKIMLERGCPIDNKVLDAVTDGKDLENLKVLLKFQSSKLFVNRSAAPD